MIPGAGILKWNGSLEEVCSRNFFAIRNDSKSNFKEEVYCC